MKIESVVATMEGHPPIPLGSIDETILSWKPRAMKQVVSVSSFERSASGLAIGRYVVAPGTGVSSMNDNALVGYDDGLKIPAQVVGRDPSLGLVMLDSGVSVKREHDILFKKIALWEGALLSVVSQFGEPWSIASLRVARMQTLKRKTGAYQGPRSEKGLTGGCVFDSEGAIVGMCTGHNNECTQVDILPFQTLYIFIDALMPGIFIWK